MVLSGINRGLLSVKSTVENREKPEMFSSFSTAGKKSEKTVHRIHIIYSSYPQNYCVLIFLMRISMVFRMDSSFSTSEAIFSWP